MNRKPEEIKIPPDEYQKLFEAEMPKYVDDNVGLVWKLIDAFAEHSAQQIRKKIYAEYHANR